MDFIKDNYEIILSCVLVLELFIGRLAKITKDIQEVKTPLLWILRKIRYFVIGDLIEAIKKGQDLDQKYLEDRQKLMELERKHSEVMDEVKIIGEEIQDFKKTNDFNHSIDVKQSMTSLKSIHFDRWLDEDEWNRYFEQEKRYVFLKKKYPAELNGHMENLMKYMQNEYILGHVSIAKSKEK